MTYEDGLPKPGEPVLPFAEAPSVPDPNLAAQLIPGPRAPASAPVAAPEPVIPAAPVAAHEDLPPTSTLPGGETYHPSPAVMLTPGHADRSLRPRGAPMIVAGAIIGIALLLAAILVALQLRPVKTMPPDSLSSGQVSPAAQPETETPSPQPVDVDEARSYDKEAAEPSIEKAKAAFRKHSPGIYEMVQEKDNPRVKPTSQGILFTWSYVDSASSQAVRVHTFTVELDDKGKAIDFYGE